MVLIRNRGSGPLMTEVITDVINVGLGSELGPLESTGARFSAEASSSGGAENFGGVRYAFPWDE